ncbi:hypothetical protein [Vagococcus xieshaowenii]|uniref:Uncharacterized protein n=1 Tax=Vagococcus xieshaowenii TaxID=2562451 RepID=A0AAJ5EFW3_9ENTE|nr:hypothetical protein [Vagococcus xieshaowenii]QCA29227.1 hypothetical protein E4Z98_07815 [Vagococcus xieshaowenii]TFZ43260.1 hypothetical protein E4031_00630 [Vagococcus xieshaowenii]
MDVQMWLDGEVFVKQQLAWLVLLMLCFLFVIIFCLLYFIKSHPKQAKQTISSCLVVMLSLSVYIMVKVKRYHFYLDNIEKIPYVTQKFEKSLLVGDKNHEMTKITPKIKHIEALNSFVLYEREEVVVRDHLDYLGKNDPVCYIKFYHTVYNVSLDSALLHFDEGVEEPEIFAYTYVLKDKAFTKAGFYPNIGPIYYQLNIPASQKELIYENSGKTSQLKW